MDKTCGSIAAFFGPARNTYGYNSIKKLKSSNTYQIRCPYLEEQHQRLNHSISSSPKFIRLRNFDGFGLFFGYQSVHIGMGFVDLYGFWYFHGF